MCFCVCVCVFVCDHHLQYSPDDMPLFRDCVSLYPMAFRVGRESSRTTCLGRLNSERVYCSGTRTFLDTVRGISPTTSTVPRVALLASFGLVLRQFNSEAARGDLPLTLLRRSGLLDWLLAKWSPDGGPTVCVCGMPCGDGTTMMMRKLQSISGPLGVGFTRKISVPTFPSSEGTSSCPTLSSVNVGTACTIVTALTGGTGCAFQTLLRFSTSTSRSLATNGYGHVEGREYDHCASGGMPGGHSIPTECLRNGAWLAPFSSRDLLLPTNISVVFCQKCSRGAQTSLLPTTTPVRGGSCRTELARTLLPKRRSGLNGQFTTFGPSSSGQGNPLISIPLRTCGICSSSSLRLAAPTNHCRTMSSSAALLCGSGRVNVPSAGKRLEECLNGVRNSESLTFMPSATKVHYLLTDCS